MDGQVKADPEPFRGATGEAVGEVGGGGEVWVGQLALLDAGAARGFSRGLLGAQPGRRAKRPCVPLGAVSARLISDNSS